MPLLEEFHRRVRLAAPPESAADTVADIVVDRDGPVRRRYPVTPGASYCLVECPEGLGDDPDHWIGRQVAFFRGRGEQVEWKTYSYDAPADLGGRLLAAGFEAEEEETLVLGDVAALSTPVRLPDGVRLREVTDDADLHRIDDLLRAVWGETPGGDDLLRSLRQGIDAGDLDVVVAEEHADGPALCAAWVQHDPRSGFAGLWGGSTRADWRRRGLYRATLAHRARLARERGHGFVRVDASADSRPVLTALGLEAAATTTPYVLRVGTA